MMYQEVRSGIVYGVAGQLILVEVEIRNGLPYFTMVGYLSKEAAEARERVASALRSIGHPLPSMKITVNLSPANIRKNGTAFDFPIAVAFLSCLGLIPSQQLKNICILGELGLNGIIRGSGGCLPIVLEALKQGIHIFFVADEDRSSLEGIEGAEIIFMKHLQDVLSYFHGNYHPIQSTKAKIFSKSEACGDFSDLQGQQHLKRAIEIAVTGKHHLLAIGSPGSGKSMAFERIPSVLHPLNSRERIEVQSIYDATGIARCLNDPRQPVRHPHPAISKAAFLGGGAHPKAGEITLAHHGILIMDEFMDFRQECLEGLRTPLEEKQITMSRLGKNLVFPADFQIFASMNPCLCGYALEDGKCRCTYQEKRRYLKKLSGPLLDRFDVVITIVKEEFSFRDEKNEKSVDIRQRITENIKEEQKLLKHTPYHFFGEVKATDIENILPVAESCHNILQNAYRQNKLTRRGMHKIMRIAMTICIMKHETRIQPIHIMEALTFRNTGFIEEVINNG